MNKYLAARKHLYAFLLASMLGVLALAVPNWVEASSASEKIRLMADALRARDSGNFDLAKSSAEELIKIAPNDENVQRLLAAINREISRRSLVMPAPKTATLVLDKLQISVLILR